MAKSLALLFFITIIFASKGQEVELPVDFRQHNLTEYNSSLFNPVFSLNENDFHSIAFWSRWQWQTVDGDPTTVLLNYTGQLNQESAIGAGFFQHNTGTFLQTGGILNYSYKLSLSPTATIAIGANILGYQQELANVFFQPDPNIQLPQLEINNTFIVQFAPGIQFSIDGFRIGVSSENLITISENQSDSSKKIYFAHTSYDFPVGLFNDDSSFIRPSIYIKSLPSYDTQIGLNTLLSTSKFWVQTGYNNFYGISVGGGAKFFKRFSIGVLIEFGTDGSIKDKDPSFELVSAFSFGKQKLRKEVVDIDEEEKEEENIFEELAENEKGRRAIDSLAVLKQTEILKQQKRVDSITSSQQNEIVAQARRDNNEQKSRDSIAQKELEQERTDFINEAKLAGVETANKKNRLNKIALRKELKQKRKDSIKTVRSAKVEVANRKAELDKIALQKKLEQKRTDSIDKFRLAETETANKKAELDEIALQKELEQKNTDSIKAVRLAEIDTVRKKAELGKVATFEENKSKTKAHYEEAVSENAQLPGYYLIANVFGTKRYYENFMKTLKDKDLEPGSFYRSINKYNYVYLRRYNTIEEAEQARINKFNGRYPDRTWIFRIK